jgi:hypothetical protein
MSVMGRCYGVSDEVKRTSVVTNPQINIFFGLHKSRPKKFSARSEILVILQTGSKVQRFFAPGRNSGLRFFSFR